MDFSEVNSHYDTELTNKLLENKYILDEIDEACGHEFTPGCGSYFFDGKTYKYSESLYTKQSLLYECAKNSKNALEIGSYLGHSLFIMLLGNPELKITCIDIEDKFTQHAVDILNKYFNDAITFIHDDSLAALDTLDEKFDLFHLDGMHDNLKITQEFLKIKKHSDSKVLRLIVNDYGYLVPLRNHINSNYHVISAVNSECEWESTYYKIQL